MTIDCYYAGFGAVHSIEFKNKTEIVWRSGTINQRLTSAVSDKYTYENVSFYFLAIYVNKFFQKYSDTKKMHIHTSMDISMINKAMKTPENESEQVLANLYKEKKIIFDTHSDAALLQASKNVAYAYFDLKKENKDIKFGNGNVDPFADMNGDRYNVYK